MGQRSQDRKGRRRASCTAHEKSIDRRISSRLWFDRDPLVASRDELVSAIAQVSDLPLKDVPARELPSIRIRHKANLVASFNRVIEEPLIPRPVPSAGSLARKVERVVARLADVLLGTTLEAAEHGDDAARYGD